jgi:hypothetical protein
MMINRVRFSSIWVALFCGMTISLSFSARGQSPAYGSAPPPAVGVHPRIFLTPSELPALRARVLSQPAMGYYQSAVQAFASFSTGPLLTAENEVALGLPIDETTSEQLSSSLRDAALVALISNDAKSVSTCVNGLIAYVDWVRPNSPGIDYGRTAPGVAVAYDYLYNTLSTAQRTQVRTWLASVCTLWATQLATEPYGFQPPATQQDSNWTGFYVGAFGITALSIEGETGYQSAWYTNAAASLTNFLQYGIGPQGAGVETIHYFSYGMVNGAYFLDAMARRGAPVWTNSHLQNVSHWWAYDLFPWGAQFNSIADTMEATIGCGEIYYRLALAYPNDPVMQWVYSNYCQSFFAAPVTLSGGILWATPPATNASAAALNLPLTGVFSYNGLAYLRSGWGTQDTYFEFQSDPVSAGVTHAHADRNSFTLMGEGRIWGLDPGTGYSYDIDHNEVLIDGIGEGYYPQPGALMATVDTGWAAAVMGNATQAYNWQVNKNSSTGSSLVNGYISTPYNPVQRAYRSATLLRGTHSYVVIADDIQKDTKSHAYAWQMLAPLGTVIDTLTPTSALFHPIETGAYLQYPQAMGQPKPIQASFSVATTGNYRFWVLMGHGYTDPWNAGATYQLDGAASVRCIAHAEDNAQMHWQDVTSALTSGIALQAGHHVLSVSSYGAMGFAALLVAPVGYDPTSAQTLTPPAKAPLVQFAGLGTPTGWVAVTPSAAEPELLVEVVSPSTVTLKGDVFLPLYTLGTPAQWPVIRFQAVAQTTDPEFRVLLYPHKKGDPMPTVVSNATGMVVSWPDGVVDTWTFGPTASFAGLNASAVQVQRKSGATSQTLQLSGKP